MGIVVKQFKTSALKTKGELVLIDSSVKAVLKCNYVVFIWTFPCFTLSEKLQNGKMSCSRLCIFVSVNIIYNADD